jgi:hypothetical protein
MIIDQQYQSSTVEAILVFPDFIFGDLPRQPGQIEETRLLTGSTGGTSISIAGSVGVNNSLLTQP